MNETSGGHCADRRLHLCSVLSVIYSNDGVFDSYRFYTKNPELVLVDTAVCAQAPVRLFASGIADGLATYVEAQAVAMRKVTPAVEAVVEANTLLSGLGFENGGLAGAHAIHNGFTAIQRNIHHLTHGEKVTYGTLTHMVLERPDNALRPLGQSPCHHPPRQRFGHIDVADAAVPLCQRHRSRLFGNPGRHPRPSGA